MKFHYAALSTLFATQFTLAAPVQPQECCAVIELRQYLLYPGKRDELISLFERSFVEPQEDVGIRVVGAFRDVNDSHRFTWIRGFGDMAARKKSLGDFYYGPIWGAHRNEANATLYEARPPETLMLEPTARSLVH